MKEELKISCRKMLTIYQYIISGMPRRRKKKHFYKNCVKIYRQKQEVKKFQIYDLLKIYQQKKLDIRQKLPNCIIFSLFQIKTTMFCKIQLYIRDRSNFVHELGI